MSIISCMTMMLILAALLVFMQYWRWQYYSWWKLPPGSMGWPYVGETLRLYTQHPNSFFSSRLKRYGEIFKSHILGCPSVMISGPDAAKLVLVSQAHLFKPTYPPSKEKIIGPDALFFHHGSYHSTLKKLVGASFLPANISPLIPDIEKIVLQTILSKWEDDTTICTFKEMKEYAFEVAIMSIFGTVAEEEIAEIKGLYQKLENGYNSMPLDFPGTPYHKAIKARKQLSESLKRLIRKRRRSGEQGEGLVGVLLKAQTEEKMLKDCQISDNIIGVIFAAQDTTASVLTWVLKYLHDNPHVLQLVKVIQETLRSASILSFTFREAVEDVEFKGYVIPKGWKVLPLFRTIHHSEAFFPQPQKFDPSRFEIPPRPYTFMPFGKGVHSCPGSELAKLEMLIILHHLTINYRWKAIRQEDAIQYGPFPVPKGGLPLRIHRRNLDHQLCLPNS